MPVIARLDTGRLRNEGGFTLVELTAAMAIGMVMLMAIFGMLDSAVSQTARVQDRIDNAQRGRLAMEFMLQDIRSQVCLGPDKPALTQGDGNSLTFYADIGADEDFNPDQYRIVYDPSTKTITEYQYQGVGTPPNNITFPALTRTHVLIENVTPIATGAPIFRYYGFTPDPVTPDQEQATPLNGDPTVNVPNSTSKTVKVSISFIARPTRLPTGANSSPVQTTFQNYVYVRTADPSDAEHSPKCGA